MSNPFHCSQSILLTVWVTTACAFIRSVLQNEAQHSTQVKGKLIASNVIIYTIIPTFIVHHILLRIFWKSALRESNWARDARGRDPSSCSFSSNSTRLLNNSMQLHMRRLHMPAFLFHYSIGGIKDVKWNLGEIRCLVVSNLQNRARVRLRCMTLYSQRICYFTTISADILCVAIIFRSHWQSQWFTSRTRTIHFLPAGLKLL